MLNTWHRYRAIRDLSYETAELTLAEVYGLPVRLTQIDENALEAFEEHWLHHPHRRFEWDWREEVSPGRTVHLISKSRFGATHTCRG